MKSRLPGLARLALLSALASGCTIGNLTWTTIAMSLPPTQFATAPNGDVWGFGKVVMRRQAGAWSLVDVCGAQTKSLASNDNRNTTLAFANDGVLWVMCGTNTSEGQALLRYDGAAAGAQVNLPNDGDVQLLQLDGDVALLGKTKLYQHVGDDFMPVADVPPTVVLQPSAGQAIDNLYAGDGQVKVVHWDGAAWLPVTIPDGAELGPIVRRAGHVFAGVYELDGETATLAVQNNAGLKRPVRPFAVIGPGAAIFLGRAPFDSMDGSGVAYFWSGKSGEDDLEFLGDAPLFSGSMYTAGGQSGYAIDDHTLLVVNLRTASSGDLLEGVR